MQVTNTTKIILEKISVWNINWTGNHKEDKGMPFLP